MKKIKTLNHLSAVSVFIMTLVVIAARSDAAAAAIQLFNTGVNGSGGLLANNIADHHYTLVAAPPGYSTAMTGNGVNDLAWLADGPDSRWIGVTSWLAEWRECPRRS